MSKQILKEYITLDHQVVKSGSSGKSYKVYVAKSDTPSEITSKNEIGMRLKRLGFIWAVNKWQLFANRTSDDVVDAIKRINDKLNTTTEQSGDLDSIQAQLEAVKEAVHNAKIPTQTKTQVEADLEKFISQIANATDAQADAIFNSYLTFTNNLLWDYSDENKLLIYAQKPHATKIAAKSDWLKKFGRDVPDYRNPSVVITINCADKMYYTNPDAEPAKRKEAEYTKEQQIADNEYEYKVRNGWMDADPRYEAGMKKRQAFHRVAFASCPVYDISDTVVVDERKANRPMETSANWIGTVNTNNDNSAVANAVFEIAKRSLIANGIHVTQNPSTAGEAGWSRRGQINVSSDVTGTYAVSTILKEWAGDLLHQEGGKFHDKTKEYLDAKGNLTAAHILQIQRVQESAVAAAISNHLGLPTNEHPTYMALLKAQGGLDSGQLIRENITTIASVSNYILKELRRHEGELNAAAGATGGGTQTDAQGAAVGQQQQQQQ